KVDLLLINSRDFDDILRRHLKREWNVLQDALVNFNYFKSWSVELIRECCILSRIKEYQPDEVLLGDGKGMVNYVHFLLEGECRLIEHMVVREERTVYGVHYELYDPGKPSAHKESLALSKASEIEEMEYELQTSKSGLNATHSEHLIDYAQLVLSSKPADKKMDFERQSIITATLLDV
ncbi:uncharacterized protein LOC113464833, partial [Ceratina calcarata]|uniref:Uncharacterized protein LOC113464833 n=1 Tax=Ceratina calcarata TaxID=156304 RepID=A0AAJ7S7I6_9HYME